MDQYSVVVTFLGRGVKGQDLASRYFSLGFGLRQALVEAAIAAAAMMMEINHIIGRLWTTRLHKQAGRHTGQQLEIRASYGGGAKGVQAAVAAAATAREARLRGNCAGSSHAKPCHG
jgi:hypothetical protein